MYKPVHIDRNIKKQPWFNRMKVEHRWFLIWLWIDEMDSIGVVEPDMDGFEKMMAGVIEASDIDFQAFADDCNNDRKDRMHIIDRGRRLWFSPTIIFNGANNEGFRFFTTSQRDAAIIKKLAIRSETRSWFLEQIKWSERIEINPALLNMVYNHKKASDLDKSFVKSIAKVIGHKILESKELPENIKQSFGCQCQYCGEIFKEYELEIDHIVPVSKVGPDQLFNKVPSCKKCNGNKSEMNVFAFLKDNGLTMTEGLKSRVEILIKKGFLSGAPSGAIKRKKKEKLYTWQQVAEYVCNNAGITTSDFELVNPESPKEERRWRRK